MLKRLLADIPETGPDESVVAQKSPVLIQDKAPVFWSLLSPIQEGDRLLYAIEYLCDAVCLTVFAPEEWLALLVAFPSTHQRHDEKMGDDANEMKACLNDIGMTAYVKSYGGADYLVVLGRQEALTYLWAKLQEPIAVPQMLRLGIGALSTNRALTTSIHVIALLEVFVGVALREIQYIINDVRLFKQLGIKHTTVVAKAISVTSASLALDEYFPVSRVVGLGLVLTSVLLTTCDTENDRIFETAMIDLVSEM